MYNGLLGNDSPDGFLADWWQMFWPVYSSRHGGSSSVKATTPVVVGNEQVNNIPEVPEVERNGMQFAGDLGLDNMLWQPEGGLLHALMNEGDISGDWNANLGLLDFDYLISSSPLASTSAASHPARQAPMRDQQWTARGNGYGANLGGTNHVNSAPIGAPEAPLPRAGHPHEGTGNDADSMPLKGLPLTGMECTVLNSFEPVPNQQFGKQLSSFQGSTNNVGNQMQPWNGLSGPDGQHARRKKNLMKTQSEDKLVLDGRKKKVKKHPYLNGESFVAYDDGNADIMSRSSRNLQSHSTEQRIPFEEAGCLDASKGKVLCCHFSSDGKWLASAGEDKKVLLWNMRSFDFVEFAEGHSLLITDVRFKPDSSVFATSSFDRTVQIWHSKEVRYFPLFISF